jgi:hypothetical protein
MSIFHLHHSFERALGHGLFRLGNRTGTTCTDPLAPV